VRTCLTLLLICAVSGCGSKPEFSHRDEYENLPPYAQAYVDEVLNTYFGTPTDMVVWDKLPLKLHTATGKVTTADNRSITLDINEPHAEISSGTELLLEAGEEAQQISAWIRSWDEESHTATLESALQSKPAEEQSVVVGPGQVLANGRHLYAEHCQHCHGVTGDGNGPTAPYLNPKPRDYRRGIFKFTTTQAPKRASREDLARVIEDGIPGTYMPSFKLLTEDESAALVEYVMWLSLRGELEYQLIRTLSDSYSNDAIKDRTSDGETSRNDIRDEFNAAVNEPDSFRYELDMMTTRLTQDWSSSQEEPAEVRPLTPRIPYSAESVAKGRVLYLNEKNKCLQCHGEAGYGDGSQTFSITKNELNQENPAPGLYDVWGNPIKPRNLHRGIYRGGRRPIDLYSRIYAGIKGTPMPAFSTTTLRKTDPDDPESAITDEDIWHLVNYILSVPFEEVKTGAGADSAKTAELATTPQEVDSH
jgi:mono/diheme cytochrome c family protein